MMPSVIPARLQFQCGHAALVTLPRVKGETATQRNDRVAHEKESALGRQCDFCAPANGTAHVELADAIETSPVEELAVLVTAEPLPEPVADAEPVPAPVEVALPVAPVPAVAVAETAPELEPQQVETPHLETNGTAKEEASPRRPRKPRAPREATRAAQTAQKLLTEYRVEYRLERVVRADSIRQALRQAATFSPADVVAITRED